MFYKHLPDLYDLKTFASLCFISSLDRGTTKFRKRMFLGYKTSIKGYVSDITTRKIYVSGNIKFCKRIFVLKKSYKIDDRDDQQYDIFYFIFEPVKNKNVEIDLPNEQK